MAKKSKDTSKEPEFTVKFMDIDELIPAEYNPRRMTEEDRRQIQASLKKFGFVDPVIVNRHPDRMNVIVGGHQRTIVAKEDLGYTQVPCTFVNLDFENERELNVRLNKNTGRFDESKLEMHFTKDFLKEIGFKEEELTFFLTDFEKKFSAITDKNCDMPIVAKFSEKYDCLFVISTNSIDTAFLETTFNIRKEQSYKNTRTGKAMVVNVQHIKEALGYGD